MKRFSIIISILTALAITPVQAGPLGDFVNWISNFGSDSSAQAASNSTADEPIVIQEPSQQEVNDITTNIIASASANGKQVEPSGIEDYSRRLARTLKQLDAEQSDRVFGAK